MTDLRRLLDRVTSRLESKVAAGGARFLPFLSVEDDAVGACGEAISTDFLEMVSKWSGIRQTKKNNGVGSRTSPAGKEYGK